jgi:hypothetical protein
MGIRDDETLQQIWDVIVFSIMSGEFPRVEDGLAGVRFVFKLKNGSVVSYRLEVWSLNGNEHSDINTQIR